MTSRTEQNGTTHACTRLQRCRALLAGLSLMQTIASKFSSYDLRDIRFGKYSEISDLISINKYSGRQAENVLLNRMHVFR